MKKTIFAVSLVVIVVTVFSSVLLPAVETNVKNEITVIIDAGHGYPDGGAVAQDGTKESDLNLTYAKKIYEQLTDNGIKCIMTRSDEFCIADYGESIHEKKVSDTRNRVKIANRYPNALLLSVHMNTFPSEDVSGAQVFYKANGNISKSIANELQNVINSKQQNSKRSIKPIPSNIYLFNHIQNECILIECGFLTNKIDLELLKNERYQDDIAKSISEVLMFKLTGDN